MPLAPTPLRVPPASALILALPTYRCLSRIHLQQSASLTSSPTLAPSGCLAAVGRRRRPYRWPLGARAGASQVAPGRAKGTYERSRR